MERLQKKALFGFTDETEDPFKDVPEIYHRTNINRFSGKSGDKRHMWLSDGSLLCFEWYTEYTIFGTYYDEKFRVIECEEGTLLLNLRKYVKINRYGVLYPRIPIYNETRNESLVQYQSDRIPIGRPYHNIHTVRIKVKLHKVTTTTTSIPKLFDPTYFDYEE